MVVEHLGKHTQNCSLVFIYRALNIYVEKDRLRGNIGAANDGGIHQRIVKFVFKILNGPLTIHFAIREQVRDHFKKVGFAAAKET
jgi:hypothetical protein